MELLGDQEGVAILKHMHTDNPTYLKFLIQEARTVFEHQVDFKSKDGAQKFRLSFDVQTQKFTVSKL